MSLLFFDGCGEYYGSGDMAKVWTDVANSPAVVAAAGRNGGNAIVIANSNETITAAIQDSGTVFMGFGMRKETLTAFTILDILSPTNQQLKFELTAAGAITVDRRTSTFLGSTADSLITAQNFHYIEIHMVIGAGTAGSVMIKLDGMEVLNLASINTAGDPFGSLDIAAIRFAGHTEADGTRFDDVYICNDQGPAPYNTFLGNIRIDAVVPDADGTTTALGSTFPASPTNHFSKVDEPTPDSDSSYNENTAASQIDLYDYAALPVDAGPVLAVQAMMLGKRVESGDGLARLIARPTGTNFNGATKGLPGDYIYQKHVWENNPQTTNAWTESEINAAEFGVEVL